MAFHPRQASFSQLMTYVRCPEHWLFRYKLGFKRSPRKVFKHGFALHETLAYHFDQKKQDGKGVKLPEAKEFFLNVLEQGLEDYKQELAETRPFLTREYLSKEHQVKVADLVETGMRGLEVYFKHLNPYIQPDLVEEAFEFAVTKELKVVGRIDLADDRGVIHELKTTRATPNTQDIRSDPQLSLYQLGYRALKKRGPTGLSKDYIVLSKNNSRMVRFKVVHPFLDRKTLLWNVASIMEAANRNIFYCMHPAESWFCSKAWCGYYTLHQELKKKGLEAFLAKYARS